jgi:hypothetical protein
VRTSRDQFHWNTTAATSSVYDGRTWYSAAISGLTANTTYYYRVFNNGIDITPWTTITFTTAPTDPGTSFQFLVVGDSQSASASATPYPAAVTIASRMQLQTPNLVMHTGDMIFGSADCLGDTSPWSQYIRNYFNVYRAMQGRIPFFTTIGNHEVQYGGCGYQAYLSVQALPTNGASGHTEEYYSFDWGNTHFVVLDSNQYLGTTYPEAVWLNNDLQATTKPWKLVFLHVPAYSSGSSGSNSSVLNNLVPIFEARGVNAVFNGHDHGYERTCPIRSGACTTTESGGVVYFTNGGGGAYTGSPAGSWFTAYSTSGNEFMKVQANGCQLQLGAINSSGVQFDSSVIDRCAGATVTPAPTTNPTNTATSVPTNTRTPTASSTNTLPPTATHTFTPTETFTPTSTYTFTPTETFTPTSTYTFTPTETYTHTATYTPILPAAGTDTPTSTNTEPPTATHTSTPTETPIPTETYTPITPGAETETPISIDTLAPTETLTPSIPPADTITPTPTETFTPTETITPTSTYTLTIPPADTDIPTSTETYTPTVTFTPDWTNTFTPTLSFTPPGTQTPSATRTQIPTSTNTSVPTRTNTFTSTFTSTRTLTRTATNTGTRTPTPASTPGPAFPQTGILDNFNRSNGAIGANWGGSTTGYNIASNQLGITTGNTIFWKAASFGGNQEVFVTFATINNTSAVMNLVLKSQSASSVVAEVEVRYHPLNKTLSVYTYNSSQGWVLRGAALSITLANGDRVGARATASGQVTIYRNGILLGTRDIAPWPNYASGGYIGLRISGNSVIKLDDFGGGTP